MHAFTCACTHMHTMPHILAMWLHIYTHARTHACFVTDMQHAPTHTCTHAHTVTAISKPLTLMYDAIVEERRGTALVELNKKEGCGLGLVLSGRGSAFIHHKLSFWVPRADSTPCFCSNGIDTWWKSHAFLLYETSASNLQWHRLWILVSACKTHLYHCVCIRCTSC